jgi:transcriptional regulator with XRE-family HTH domain
VRILIGDRLREFREAKKLSQGDIGKRTGLLRPYISRAECGHAIYRWYILRLLSTEFVKIDEDLRFSRRRLRKLHASRQGCGSNRDRLH